VEKIRTAVVGVGKIAQIAHLPVLKKMENVELVAVCDVDEKKMAHIIQKFNVPRWYNLVDELIEHEPIDALHICTANYYHYPMALMALRKGIHVFVEKPLALSVRHAQKIAEVAKQAGRTVMVGMQHRFRDDVQILKEFLSNNELGELFFIKGGWLKKWSKELQLTWEIQKQYSGGGVLMDFGIHLIDMMLYLTGMPKIRTTRLFPYQLRDGLEVEDSAMALLETEDGLGVNIETSWNLHLDHDIQYTHIFGKKGSAYLNPLRIQKEMHGNLVTVTPIQNEKPQDRYLRAYETEIHHFYDVIAKKAKNMSPPEDAVKVLQVIEALYASAEKGREILVEQ